MQNQIITTPVRPGNATEHALGVLRNNAQNGNY